LQPNRASKELIKDPDKILQILEEIHSDDSEFEDGLEADIRSDDSDSDPDFTPDIEEHDENLQTLVREAENEVDDPEEPPPKRPRIGWPTASKGKAAAESAKKPPS